MGTINGEFRETLEDLKESYNTVIYVSKAFPNTNINSLQARGRLYGLSPAPLKGARVLELGSSCGGNIIPQALYYPETTFTGIDLLDQNMVITRTNDDGQPYRISSSQYLEDVLSRLQLLGFFRNV